MDVAVILGGAGVIAGAFGMSAALMFWAIKGAFNTGGSRSKAAPDKKNGAKTDAETDALNAKIDAVQADMRQVINMLTALANHRHDVDGNTMFNVPPNPANSSNS